MDRKLALVATMFVLTVSPLVCFLILGTARARAQDNSHWPVDVVRIMPARCSPVGDFSSIEQSITVPSGSLVILQQPWLFKKESNAKAFLKNTERVVTLGGEPIDNEVDYWAGEIFKGEFPDDSEVLIIYWIYPASGPLPDGKSLEVHWEFTALHDFSDGYLDISQGYHVERDCTIIWGD